jgi:hypothetical protein
VLDHGGPYVELCQARLRPNGRAGPFDADLDNSPTAPASIPLLRCELRGTALGGVHLDKRDVEPGPRLTSAVPVP